MGSIDQSRRQFMQVAGAGVLAAAAAAPATAQLAPPDKQPANLPVPNPDAKKVG
jgi:Rieske Fe-S protein